MSTDLALQHMPEVLRLKYGPSVAHGWTPRLRARFGYRSPDDWYEATLFHFVGPSTEWLDVGCGRNVFPSNPAGAAFLARTCRLLVGIDPSRNVRENDLVHEWAQCLLQDYKTDRKFDLVTLRMVAEHIEDPVKATAALARLVRPGGRAIVYTVAKFSPASLLAAATPLSIHHAAKRFLWDEEERDAFPVAYRMNTRRQLRQQFQRVGFREESFRYLDDCRSFGRWKPLAAMELATWRGLRSLGLRYPEGCLLGIYQRNDATRA